MSPKLGFRGQKRGQKFGPLKILIPLLDSKFDVDFGFAINHDLIS